MEKRFKNIAKNMEYRSQIGCDEAYWKHNEKKEGGEKTKKRENDEGKWYCCTSNGYIISQSRTRHQPPPMAHLYQSTIPAHKPPLKTMDKNKVPIIQNHLPLLGLQLSPTSSIMNHLPLLVLQTIFTSYIIDQHPT